MVYKYECNAMRKGSSFLQHSSVQLSASAESRQQSVCVCRRAQLFFYLGAKERERKVTRLLTWPLIAGTNILFVLILMRCFDVLFAQGLLISTFTFLYCFAASILSLKSEVSNYLLEPILFDLLYFNSSKHSMFLIPNSFS